MILEDTLTAEHNPLGEKLGELHRKLSAGETFTPDEYAEYEALREFGYDGNVEGYELAVLENKGHSLTKEQAAKLGGHRRFKGNRRLAHLEARCILRRLTPEEEEELYLASYLYWDESSGGKPWETDPEDYTRKKARIEELRAINEAAERQESVV